MLHRLFAVAASATLATVLTAGVAAAQTAPAAPAPAPAAAAGQVTPHGDIIETVRAAGEFTTFLKAADATNLTALIKSTPNLTVFAPTDAAFAALPPGRLDALMNDKAALQKLLTHHLINARMDSSKFKNAKGPVPSVAGDQVMLDGSGDVLKVDNATIVQSDVMASNGILHVVDAVMMPGAAAASASAPAAGNAG